MIKEMYCDYRKHIYHIGDVIYIDETNDYDTRDRGEYGKIIEFKELDNCKRVIYDVISDSEGNKIFLCHTSVAYLGNIQPAKEAIQCKINELQSQIDFFKELLKNE